MQRRGLIPKSPVRTIIRSSLRWVLEQSKEWSEITEKVENFLITIE